ncbi:MAG: collagen-like protein [Pseudomonadota bacterium]
MTDLTYTTGAVSVAANGTVVTGSGTFFSNLRQYDFISINKLPIVPVITVTDDTHLVIPIWQGGAQTSVSYVAYKMSPLRFVGSDSAVEMSKTFTYLNDKGVFYAVTGAVPDPSIGNDGDYALKTNTGAWMLWLRVSGAWVAQATPVGTTYKGVWNSATTYSANDVTSRLGSSYVSKTTNTNKAPESNSSDWDVLAAQGSVGPAPTISGTSASTVSVAAGSQSFTTQAGIAFVIGQRVVVSNPDASLVMAGPISSYSGTTLQIVADYATGTGSSNNWTISITGAKGQKGDKGDQGNASTVPGPQGPTGAASTVPGPQGIQGVTGQGIAYSDSGTLAQRGAHDNEIKNYAFLQTDTAPFRLWIKASNGSADWAGPTYIGGAAAVGDLGSVTDSILQTFDYGVAA